MANKDSTWPVYWFATIVFVVISLGLFVSDPLNRIANELRRLNDRQEQATAAKEQP